MYDGYAFASLVFVQFFCLYILYLINLASISEQFQGANALALGLLLSFVFLIYVINNSLPFKI